MQFTEFIDIKDKTRVDEDEEALKAIEATLETLGERIYRNEKEVLAAQLPFEINGFLLKRSQMGQTPRYIDRFNLEEFYNRVAARMVAATGKQSGGQKRSWLFCAKQLPWV